MSELFFRSQNCDERHTDEYVIADIEKMLNKQGHMKFDDIFNHVKEVYPNESINHLKLRTLVEQSFSKCAKNIYCLSEQQKQIIANKCRNTNQITEFSQMGEKALLDKFDCILSSDNYDWSELLQVFFAIGISRGQITLDNAIVQYNDISVSQNIYESEIHDAVTNISNENQDVTCYSFIENPVINSYLDGFGIHKASDFNNVPTNVLLMIMSFDVKKTLYDLKSLSHGIDDQLCIDLQNYFLTILDDRSFDILKRRYGLDGNASMTLEECASIYGLTRERVRQIEAKSIKKIKDTFSLVSDSVNVVMKSHLCNRHRNFIEFSEFSCEIGSENVARLVAFLYDILDLTFGYSEKYGFIFLKDKTNENEIVNNILDKYGIYITPDYYENASSIEKNIIDENYRTIQSTGSLLIKEKYFATDLYNNFIAEIFPDGYRTYNKEDYLKFVECYKLKCGENAEIPTQVAIRGLFNRENDFCQVDKGTYKLRTNCVGLPDQLVDEIIDCIIANMPVVNYQTIYYSFSDELTKLGVMNYFYMKGLIDPYLPGNIKSERNYLHSTETSLSSVDVRQSYIRNTNSLFTLDDLRKKFPGVKDYTFMFMLYDEMQNGLLWLSSHRFIYFDKTGISQETTDNFKKYVKDIFIKENSKILTSRKIYGKMKIFNKDELSKLHYIDDQFALFSLIKYLFGNQFHFHRPYISLDDDQELTTQALLYDELTNKKTFTYSDVGKFYSKMGIYMNKSWQLYMEDFSDDFIQTDAQTLMRKDILDIKENQLKEIHSVLHLIMDKTSAIQLKDFIGYQMFPTIKLGWNKYILAGIVRSYFDDEFQVLSDGQDYRVAEYEIRRINSNV